MRTASEPRMFTEEEHATRALGAAFHHDHEFAISWLRTIGLDVNSIVGVSVERPYVVPDPDGGERRADVYLEVTGLHGELGEGEEAGANSEVVIIEAKIDALLDEEQLEHAGRVADRVVCLIPRSEEHTSELQSRGHLVCRLLLEKKKKKKINGRREKRVEEA